MDQPSILFTGRVTGSHLDLDPQGESYLALTIAVTGALPTRAALAAMHPIERCAAETWGLEPAWLTVEVQGTDLAAAARQFTPGHTISGAAIAADLTPGFSTRHQLRLVARAADLAA